MEKTIIGGKIKIMADTCENLYQDLIGKTVTVVDMEVMDDNMFFYTVTGTGRKSKSPYLKGDEEIVFGRDVEIIEYAEFEPIFK
ncbi:hypothetical protein [Ornithinibacillus sp. 179-J 7C1 HS]|uniref:hypothetical protein n=1 Tax=Ornithinibacillus sp. 179-J 7C1 HS TaxID=3142384 RepID=UPI00399F5050